MFNPELITFHVFYYCESHLSLSVFLQFVRNEQLKQRRNEDRNSQATRLTSFNGIIIFWLNALAFNRCDKAVQMKKLIVTVRSHSY